METWVRNGLIKRNSFRSSHRRCSIKFFLQNSQENTCARVSFFKQVASLRPATLLKKRLKRLWHRCFSVNFCKIFKNTFFTEDVWATASFQNRNMLKSNFYLPKKVGLICFIENPLKGIKKFFISS